MYSAASPSPFGRPPHHAKAYSSMAAHTGVADATPHRLIAMLFDGCLAAVNDARGAIRARDVERKGKAISRAVGIVEEGLRAGLNLKAGGELAADLDRLYAYVAMRLTQANLKSSEAALDECQRLLQPLREAWMGIAKPDGKQDA